MMDNQHREGRARLAQVLTLVGCLVALLAAAGGSLLWLLQAQAALEGYRPPIREQPQPGGEPTSPLARQVVLVLIDGLRDDTVAALPTLSLLRRQGASAQVALHTPSYSQPAWTTLVTGAWPELNGSAPLNAEEADLQPIAPDTIFDACRRAGLSTALLGASWWEKMVPPSRLDAHLYVPGFFAADDQQVAQAAPRLLQDQRPNFTLIYFGNVDETAHAFGGASPQYLQAALVVDDYVRDIAAGIDLQETCLIVTSDHGHIDRGGHGGGDPIVVTTPLIAIGAGIEPGRYRLDQVDVAPTLAAILGAPLPRLSQGAARLEMLRAGERQRAEVEVGLALQRRELGNLYLRDIGRGPLSAVVTGVVDIATHSLQAEDYGNAYNLARKAAERIDAEMAQGRANRIAHERLLRAPVALACVLAPLAALAAPRRGRRRRCWLLFCGAATLLIYNALYLLQGEVYSFSGLTGLEPFLLGTLARVAIASGVGGLLVLAGLLRQGRPPAGDMVRSSLGYSLLTVYLLGVLLAILYALNGLAPAWYIPDLDLAFWQLSALVQALGTAVVGLILPLGLLLLAFGWRRAAALSERLRTRNA